METLRDALLVLLVFAGALQCSYDVPSRGPVDPWVTGSGFTDSDVGCIYDCTAPAE